VNGREKLEPLVERAYPWCREEVADLKRLFGAYVDRKHEQRILDYDDLLLFLHALLDEPAAGEAVRRRFDFVLVDEYQDTNALQAEILRLLRPGGHGLTAVGDDAQAIYSFRAATVRNILDFPRQFAGASVRTLETNYRSTPPLVAATNAVIAQATERHEKELRARRGGGAPPLLVSCRDEEEQTAYVVGRVLAHREEGVALRKQAVLFRASHHSLALELDLARRNVPFHKYGGLKFVEAAHVKDLVAFLRLVENPRDVVSGTRVLLLLPGVGPAKARKLMEPESTGEHAFEGWAKVTPPSRNPETWRAFVALLRELSGAGPGDVPSQVRRVRNFWAGLVEEKYDDLPARLRDLEQLEQIASRWPDRRTFLAELALDPPASTQDLAGPPLLDDDYLVLSTIHSAKGLEFDAVYVIHAADGNIPSDMATGSPAEIEEELRLFYVALTRARDHLYVAWPHRYYRRPGADAHSWSQLTRFLSESVQPHFERRAAAPPPPVDEAPAVDRVADVRGRIRGLWA
jgi:DNA helicase-2/ATP-dependent DNA helicase PcrA